MTVRVVRPLSVLAVLFAFAALAAWPAPAFAAGAVTLPGEEKPGSDDAADPVEITAGSWQGSIGPGEDGHRFYQYRRTIEKSSVLLSVLASVRTDDSDEVTVAVKAPDGTDCGDNYTSAYGEEALAFSTSLRVGLNPDDEGKRDGDLDSCLTGDILIIELGRGSSDSADDLPATLTVVEEAPVEDTSGLPQAAEESTAFAAPAVSDTADAQGGSFSKPTDLESGSAVRGSVRTASAVVYRVRVDWGQSLHARLVLPNHASAAFTTVGVTILDPRYVSGFATEVTASLSDSESTTATAVAGPVRYLNRVDSGNPPYLPGDYYVVVVADVLTGSQQVDIDYTLQMEVTGKRSGVPAYGTDEPFVVADDHTAAVVSTPGQDAGWGVGLDAGWTLARVATVAGLGLLGVVSLGWGVHLLRRR